MTDSPIDLIQYKDLEFFVKRDDLLDFDLSGNKARKLYATYIEDLSSKKTLIAFGGNQSNLMYSLSAFCKQRDMKYIYFAKKLSKQLKNNIDGNLKGALDNGMKLIQVEHQKWHNFIEKLKNTNLRDNTIFIHQGGLQKEAELGLKILAEELNDFFETKNNYCKTVKGTGFLKYYLFNMKFEEIQNEFNGLVTL